MLLKPIQPVSVEQLIRSGCLPIGELDTPRHLANFLRSMNGRMQPRHRRPGVVGNIDTVYSNTSSSIALSWDVARSTGLPVPLRSSGPNQLTATNVRQSVAYTFGSTGAGCINQVAQATSTCTNGTPLNFNISVWASNVVGDASATFTAIKELWIELLTVAQGGGASSSDITMGNHATNAWAALLGATGTYAIKSGGLWHHQDQTSAGLAVTAGDFIKTLNNDAANIASIRFTVFGFK